MWLLFFLYKTIGIYMEWKRIKMDYNSKLFSYQDEALHEWPFEHHKPDIPIL